MRRVQLLTSFGDLIIPILLFYWWQWDLHFILLFLFIDILSAAVFALIKERKIQHTQHWIKTKSNWPKRLVLYSVLSIAGIVLYEFGIIMLYPEMNLWQSFQDFLWFKEFGIPQVVWLVPLLILVNYQQYKTLFIMPRLHEVTPISYQEQTHFYTFALFAISGSIFLGLSFFISTPKDLFLFLLIFTKLFSDLYVLPKLQENNLKKMVNSQRDKR